MFMHYAQSTGGNILKIAIDNAINALDHELDEIITVMKQEELKQGEYIKGCVVKILLNH